MPINFGSNHLISYGNNHAAEKPRTPAAYPAYRMWLGDRHNDALIIKAEPLGKFPYRTCSFIAKSHILSTAMAFKTK
jgi:hypothetical protein